MFETLTSSFQRVFKNLRGYGKLTEGNIQEAMREVRLALLEADVNFNVVRDFVNRVKEGCLGQQVYDHVSPGQQVIKCVHDEMVKLLGAAALDFDWSVHPAVVMLLGLHGAGKTTTAGKLARRWQESGKKVLLVAADIRRPAAVAQLRLLAEQAGVAFLAPEPGETVPNLGKRALQFALKEKMDVVLLDTGGRFQVDDDLVGELKELRDATNPKNVVLVLDAAIGQQSVAVAEAFNKEVGLTGLILTKLDGDARGGAALSVRAVTGCPVLLVGHGEKIGDLDVFYPERLAARILGMGDVVSLVEKAQQQMDEKAMAVMGERLRKNVFDLEDLLAQIKQLKKLGPMEHLLDMLPSQLKEGAKGNMAASSEEELKTTEAVILSMTREERQRPELMNASRRRRVARGCGKQVSDVNSVLRRFEEMKRVMKQMKGLQKKLLKLHR